jgi:hypothetical protein
MLSTYHLHITIVSLQLKPWLFDISPTLVTARTFRCGTLLALTNAIKEAGYSENLTNDTPDLWAPRGDLRINEGAEAAYRYRFGSNCTRDPGGCDCGGAAAVLVFGRW